MNQINPKSLKIIKGLPPTAKKGDKVSLDTEWRNQIKSRLHRPHGDFAFLGCSFDGETVYWIDDTASIQEFLDRLDAGVWIFVNAKYDITQLRKYANIRQRSRLWDCFLIEQIMYSGYYDNFSLADMARRRLDLYVSKAVRDEFSQENAPEPSSGQIGLSKEQLEYSATDVAVTWQVYKHQRAEIDETDLEIWKEIELPFLWTLLSMDGVKLDTEKWIALAEKNDQKAKAIQSEYGQWKTVELRGMPTRTKKTSKEIFEGTNLNSPKQVKESLWKMGYKVKSTDEEALTKLADENVQFATDVLAYRKYAKRASTYGKKFIEDYVEEDGRIYGDIFQMGAQTGRTSSRSPNLQNQPHDFEYRDCFIAEEGNVMIVADWGAQEPRIGAYWSQDEGLIKILNSDKKLYIEIARDALGINITKQDAEYTHIKSTILGIFYGMSAYGLAKQIKVSEEEAEEMIALILDTYPGIQEYINRQSQVGEYVQSIYGRKIWLNKYNSGWLRDALNYPIQSSAADAMKIAANDFTDKATELIVKVATQFKWKLVLLVHDEIVLEIPRDDEELAGKTLSEIMISVAEEMHDGIKGSVEIFSGASWGCKK